MKHTANMCQSTKLEARLQSVQYVEDDAVNCMKMTVTTAIATEILR